MSCDWWAQPTLLSFFVPRLLDVLVARCGELLELGQQLVVHPCRGERLELAAVFSDSGGACRRDLANQLGEFEEGHRPSQLNHAARALSRVFFGPLVGRD